MAERADFLELIADLKTASTSSEKADTDRCSDILSELAKTSFDEELVKLRKHADEGVRTKAKMIARQWKSAFLSSKGLIVKHNMKFVDPATVRSELSSLVAGLSAPDSLHTNDVVSACNYEFDESAVCDKRRIAVWQKGDKEMVGPVIYWMQRDQRVQDNWALVRALTRAMGNAQPLVVVFCLSSSFLGATLRQYGFMLRGLRQLERDLATLAISFRVLLGDPAEQLPRYAKDIGATLIVTDYSPMRTSTEWKNGVKDLLPNHVRLEEVDTHNIVPCRVASDKEEVGARTIRGKLHGKMNEWLKPFPRLVRSEHVLNMASEKPAWDRAIAAAADIPMGELADGLAPQTSDGRTDWGRVVGYLKIDTSVPELRWAKAGERAAAARMRAFLEKAMAEYGTEGQNAARPNGQSNLSPYLHFGQISAQRVALEIMRATGQDLDEMFVPPKAQETGAQQFLEELVVRRELSDNYCANNEHYDSFEGLPAWARESLRAHADDKRPFIYSKHELETASTHDSLWNAAQRELVYRGKTHGYMRMYWAKKILEWTATPEEAISIAIELNDKYSLDGRDPNGYVGILWCIGGLHDQGWKEREVVGKVRYMSTAACEKKFHIPSYIATVNKLVELCGSGETQ